MSQEKDWGKTTLVSSQRIKAGTRYYYIDAKLDSKGNKYIVLSETKLKEGEAKPERHRIFIYEEDFGKLTRALAETILSLSGEAALSEALPALSATTAHTAAAVASAPTVPEDSEEHDSKLDEELSLEGINIEWNDEA